MRSFLRSTLGLALVCGVAADYDNFPVKSVNIAGAASVEFYSSPALASYNIFDVHPVHGCATSDGSYVMAGKALESEDGSFKKAFAVKLSSAGAVQWVWGSTASGVDDAANAVLQLPSGGDIIVAGYRSTGGKNQRSLTKLALSDGTEKWTATWAGTGGHGAWEMIDTTKDGSSVLLAGLQSAESNEEFNFKSYGNVVSGNAIVTQLPLSALTGASAPAESAATWSYTTTSYFTSKAARSMTDGSVIALLYSETQLASLVKLTSTGTVAWGPTNYASQHGEGTDVVVAADEGSFMMTGQGDGGVTGSLSGRLSKVSLTGAYQWGKSYTSTPYDGSAGPHANLIKNECWGMQATADGYVVGCGTGIEDCNGYSGDKLSACNAGTADTRTGAVARKKSIWQSMIFRTDLDGTLLWLRTDQYRESGSPAVGTSGWQAQSSASEYVIVTSDGGIASINDEVGGIGLLRLSGGEAGSGEATGGASSTNKPPSAPAAEEEGEFPLAAVVGGVVGGLVVVACLVLLLVWKLACCCFAKKPDAGQAFSNVNAAANPA